MDIFKMATELANNMSMEDKNALENMDMQKMISHVTKNVLTMMNNLPQESVTVGSDSDTDSDPENTIYPRTRDICFDLNVDLEDFYTGKKKKLNVKRKRMIEVDGKQKIVEEKKKLIVPIEKGMKDEQQIRFEGEADQIPGYKSGDIVITLIENDHPIFERDADNLIIIKNINLYQSYDLTFDIKHLDGTIIQFTKESSDALHLNDSIRKVTGLGMPSYKENGTFGDLFIRFNLVLPKLLSDDKLNKLKEIFNDSCLENNSSIFSQSVVLENVTDTDLEYLESSDSEDSEEYEDSDDSEVSDVSSVSDGSSEVVYKKK